jgi:hypothetical protein
VSVLASGLNSLNKMLAARSLIVSKLKHFLPSADALKFNGPVPELVNVRLAMVGFVNIVAHEVAYGEGVAVQAGQLDAPTLLALGMWVVATLAPVLKGVRNNEAFGEMAANFRLLRPSKRLQHVTAT